MPCGVIHNKFLCAFAPLRENKSCKRDFSSAPPAAAKPSAASPKCAPHCENNPDGDPLIFLAPKQATFQLERQLLADLRSTATRACKSSPSSASRNLSLKN